MDMDGDKNGDSFKRFLVFLPVIIGILAFIFMLDLIIGSVTIPVDAFVKIITGGQVKETWMHIFWDWRMPKAITALLAGGSLALSGLLMQTFFRNPLADPYILGISSGASLGVAFVMLSAGIFSAGTILGSFGFVGDMSISLAAIIGAFMVLLLIIVISAKIQSNITILVLGIMVAYMSSAMVTILLQFSDQSAMHAYSFWTFGSFSGVTWSQLPIMTTLLCMGYILSICLVKPLNALLLGEQYAESMGMNYRRIRHGIIITTAFMAGGVTAFCGPIGFLGIAIPHFCRSIFVTADHRILVPGCILLGGIIALLTDIISHLPGTDIVLPLNAITALFGAPVVIWVILRGTRFGRGVIS